MSGYYFLHFLRGIVALGFFAAASVTIITVARLITNRRRGSLDGGAAQEERIARLEQAVEALTVDSGRLIEGQRFLSQLLTERSGAAQPAGRFDRT